MKRVKNTSVLGTLSSGRGKATKRQFEANPDLTAHFGRPCKPGTANLLLPYPMAFDKLRRLPFSHGFEAFWSITVGGLDCVAFRYKRCPLHVVEVISPEHIRDRLALQDGDTVELCGPLDRPGPLSALVWWAIWSGHEARYYTDDAFVVKTHRHKVISRHATQPSERW